MRFCADFPCFGGRVVLKRSIGLVAILLATSAVAAGVYFIPPQPRAAVVEAPTVQPGDAPAATPTDTPKATPVDTPKAAPKAAPKAGQKVAAVAKDADSFGYTAAFDAELKKVGQISTQQFADRYPAPKYLGKLSFDPTTAKFFNEVNVEKLKKPGMVYVQENGKEIIGDAVEIPGYKLTPDELEKFK